LQETGGAITFSWQIRLLAKADFPSIINVFRVLHGRRIEIVLEKLPAMLLRGLAGRIPGQVDKPTFAPALVEIEMRLFQL